MGSINQDLLAIKYEIFKTVLSIFKVFEDICCNFIQSGYWDRMNFFRSIFRFSHVAFLSEINAGKKLKFDFITGC